MPGIPMASAYGSYDNSMNAIPNAIPVYAIHGEDDTIFPLENTQNWIDDVVASGGDVTFVVAPGLNHLQACDYTPYLQDAATWLINEIW